MKLEEKAIELIDLKQEYLENKKEFDSENKGLKKKIDYLTKTVKKEVQPILEKNKKYEFKISSGKLSVSRRERVDYEIFDYPELVRILIEAGKNPSDLVRRNVKNIDTLVVGKGGKNE